MKTSCQRDHDMLNEGGHGGTIKAGGGGEAMRPVRASEMGT